MRIFLAGATGVIGRPLLARLVEAGHEVTALTRAPERAEPLRARGARPVVGDVFDRESLGAAAKEARPEVVIHQLTALPQRINPRKVDRDLAPTNRLRDEGTRNLVEAARLAGARRFIAQSIAFAYAPGRDELRVEEDPLFLDAPESFRGMVQAVDSLERTTTETVGIEGVVLRYGFFHGPGTIYAPDGTFAEDVRARRVPIISDGDGVFSFIAVEDAAAATVAALDRAPPGIYNVVDDEPLPVAQWLPEYARALGAKRPLRIPRLAGRLGAGAYGIYLMTQLPGVSNARAKAALDWQPRSWRSTLGTLVAS